MRNGVGLILGLRPANEKRRYVSHWLGVNLESALRGPRVCVGADGRLCRQKAHIVIFRINVPTIMHLFSSSFNHLIGRVREE